MKSPREIFHTVSYLQYLFLLASLIFYVPFIMSLALNEPDWTSVNNALILYGLSMSFSTLQDTTKTQNKVSQKIWQHPKKGKMALWGIVCLAFAFIIIGLTLFFSPNTKIQEISVGLIVLGIGFIGVLKAAIEMFENHRMDKQALESKEKVS